MTTKHRVSLVLAGFVIWATGTLLFRSTGSYFFESSVTEYWMTVVGIEILCVAVYAGLMKLLQIEPKNWLQGAICLALPGMLSEIPILFDFSHVMTDMQPETAGRYAAFLFSGYVAIIGLAWFVVIKADSHLSLDGK